MIIDCHTHIFPGEVRKDREVFCKRDKGFSSIYKNSKARLIGVEELITSMDEWGIDRSVICGFPWAQPDLCFLHNQYLLEAASRYPNRLIVFVMLSFSNPNWSEKELVRAMQGGARGVGRLPSTIIKWLPGISIHETNPFPDGETGNSPSPPYQWNAWPFLPWKREDPSWTFLWSGPLFSKPSDHLRTLGGGLPFYELMQRWPRGWPMSITTRQPHPFSIRRKFMRSLERS